MSPPVQTSDVLVLGAGPAGYVAAARCAQLGLTTTIVDGGPPGGTCLNIGCIPSKALIHAAEQYATISRRDGAAALGISAGAVSLDLAATMAWKDGIVARLRSGVASLLDGATVTRVDGRARIVDGKTVEVDLPGGPQTLRCSHLVIATGSRPAELPDLPFGGNVISSTEALALTEIPGDLVVVGAGYIGLELGTAFAKLGARVVIVEVAEQMLAQYDPALVRPVARRLHDLGVEVLLRTVATGLSSAGELTVVDAAGAQRQLAADKVLVTTGRVPATERFGLERLDLTMTGRSIRIDDRCRTSMRGVYAIGDVTGEPMLAHRASAQGELVADVIAGRRSAWDKRAIPAVCFTDPEIFTVGLSPADLTNADADTISGTARLAASGRALTLDRPDGFVRVVARRDDHLVLGVQAVGAGVSELSGGCALAVEMGATLVDLAATVHAHPTLTEAVREAAVDALARAGRAESRRSEVAEA